MTDLNALAERLERARKAAWETRRAKYGPRGHAGDYSRSSRERGAMRLVVALHVEGVLSEGQVCAETGIDRVHLRILADQHARSALKERGGGE